MDFIPIEPGDLIQFAVAILAGLAVGLERELSDKPAGIKTFIFVTLAATFMMQLSIRLAGQFGSEVDVTRIAAGAITGIGFLGAGSMIRHKHSIEGLTTAATIWLMTGVGLAIGAGYFYPAIGVVVIVLFWYALKTPLEKVTDVLRRRFGRKGGKDEDDHREA